MEEISHRLRRRSVRDGTCLRWRGAHTQHGYGQVRVAGKMQQAHRVAYECWVGPIPTGLDIDHVAKRGCRFRDCIEPSHLEPVTAKENAARKTRPRNHVGPHVCGDDLTLYRRVGGRLCERCTRPERDIGTCARGHSYEPGSGGCDRCSREQLARVVACASCGKRVMYKSIHAHFRDSHKSKNPNGTRIFTEIQGA